jgi:hypothetical protein
MGNIRAKTTDYITTNLAAFTDNGFQPTPQDDPDATVISTRHLLYLPDTYAAFMLNPSGYTLRQTWELLYQAIIN